MTFKVAKKLNELSEWNTSIFRLGTLWQPIRFKPINVTELAESQGKIGTLYRRKRRHGVHNWHFNHKSRNRNKQADVDLRFLNFSAHRSRRHIVEESQGDEVFRKFPELIRENPQFQRLSSLLIENDTRQYDRGFLHFYNKTTGEIVPSCDIFFTLRNAQVVCRWL